MFALTLSACKLSQPTKGHRIISLVTILCCIDLLENPSKIKGQNSIGSIVFMILECQMSTDSKHCTGTLY